MPTADLATIGGTPGALDWQSDGTCREIGGNLWFPVKTGPANQAARKYCFACPVRADCLSYAIANDERFGIWGGLTQGELRAIAAKRRAQLLGAQLPEPAGLVVDSEVIEPDLVDVLLLPAADIDALVLEAEKLGDLDT